MRIYLFAVAAQLLAVTMLLVISDELPASDPWYQWQAEALTDHGLWEVEWVSAPFEVQSGSYRNWRPPLYSVVVAAARFIDSGRTTLFILQMLLYAWIPVLIFRIVLVLLSEHERRQQMASIAAYLWIINPQFLLSGLQILDTMMTTLLLLFSLLMLFRISQRGRLFAFSSGLVSGTLYLVRPVGFLALAILHVFRLSHHGARHRMKILPVTIAGLFLPAVCWAIIQFAVGSDFLLGYTSTGYNLWLGNNPETLEFMRRTHGDAATIEDRIFAEYQGKITDIARADEEERNRMFTRRALAFMRNHPVQTLENMFWKVVGFWSPFRSREGHFSDSWKKESAVLAYQIPLLLLSCITVLHRLLSPQRMRGKGICTICLLIALWMLPHLFFFATPRFRAPLDPLLLYLAVLSIPSLSFLRKQTSGGEERR